MFADVVADERTDHEDVGMGEIDEPEHAINHRVAERDERVYGSEGEAVEKLLEEFGHLMKKKKRESGKLRAESGKPINRREPCGGRRRTTTA